MDKRTKQKKSNNSMNIVRLLNLILSTTIIKSLKDMNKYSIEKSKACFETKHFSRIMTLRVILFFFCIMLSQAVISHSQENMLLHKLESVSIKDACKEIEKQTGLLFVFADNTESAVNTIKKVDLANISNESISNVMDNLLSDTDLEYKILDQQVVIYKNDKAQEYFSLQEIISDNMAQQKKKIITGKVFDENGEPVIGANVLEKGTTNGTITDLNGNFTLQVEDNAIVHVSYMGYLSQDINTAGKSNFDITLVEDIHDLDELVVVGYGTMKKRDVTGSITSITGEDISKKIPANVYQALQGQAPGVQIVMGSGQPGESARINIRGISTFSSEGVTPLYIVDGAPLESIDGINPSDIESLEILKDAASASIYGSRSANGVIIITTKSGKKGKPSIDIKYNHAGGQLSHKLPQANREERREYDLKRREYFLANGMTGNANESIQMIEDSLNVFFNVDNDYQKMILQTSLKDQIDLSIGGASDKIKYFVNTGFFNEKGIIPNTGFQRLTARMNSDYTPNNWLNMGTI